MSTLSSTRTLAIETSCDETACAIVENGRALLASTVASQMDIHADTVASSRGGFPAAHPFCGASSRADVEQGPHALSDIDAIIVTRGPAWLVHWCGIEPRQSLAMGTGLPLVGVNHLEGHIYSAWVYQAGDTPPPEPQFPCWPCWYPGGTPNST